MAHRNTQRMPGRPSQVRAAECALVARQQVENAIALLTDAARSLRNADILHREMKSLRGTCDCLSIIHRSLDDFWARWRDITPRVAASDPQASKLGAWDE